MRDGDTERALGFDRDILPRFEGAGQSSLYLRVGGRLS